LPDPIRANNFPAGQVLRWACGVRRAVCILGSGRAQAGRPADWCLRFAAPFAGKPGPATAGIGGLSMSCLRQGVRAARPCGRHSPVFFLKQESMLGDFRRLTHWPGGWAGSGPIRPNAGVTANPRTHRRQASTNGPTMGREKKKKKGKKRTVSRIPVEMSYNGLPRQYRASWF